MKKTRRVLDSYAVLAFLNGEIGCDRVRDLLLAEARQTGVNRAILSGLPIRRAPNDFEQVIAAARLKAEYPLSYADCFVVATAVREGAIVPTGDPGFKSVESVVPIEWVGDQPGRTARRRPRV